MDLSSLPNENAAVVGLALPILLSVIIQSKWSTRTQSIVALAACLVVGGGVALLENTSVAETVGQVIAATFISYKAFWEPTGIADSVESATNFGGEDV
jgi:hypothetical protein